VSSGTFVPQKAPDAVRHTRPLCDSILSFDTFLLDLCYSLVTIEIDKEVLPMSEGADLSMGALKTIFTNNEPTGGEDWRMVLKALVNALAPSAQPFRMTGKGSPGRGSGPRLTDRKHYK
jgi:hypothetical protein